MLPVEVLACLESARLLDAPAPGQPALGEGDLQRVAAWNAFSPAAAGQRRVAECGEPPLSIWKEGTAGDTAYPWVLLPKYF